MTERSTVTSPAWNLASTWYLAPEAVEMPLSEAP
jgi:hypothetical protein